MARADGDESSSGSGDPIRRQVARTVANWVVVGVSLAVIAGWASTGFYTLDPGEAAVILRLGSYSRTVLEPGPRLHLPPPLEYAEKVNVIEIRREKFGFEETKDVEPGAETATFETAIQTADQNIVNLSYVVQYRIDDPFSFLYGLASPDETLRDAAQASVREVVGAKNVDGVLSAERGQIEDEAEMILQSTLADYFSSTEIANESAFRIDRVSLQIVQPPAPVQEAFDDVVAAQQDEARSTSLAQGDAQEILQRAEAEAQELLESATAYKQAKILEAKGEADRFVALYQEYARAPEVTRRRLYLETMEQVMPGIEKLIVEPDTVNMLPFFPLSGTGGPGTSASREDGEEGSR